MPDTQDVAEGHFLCPFCSKPINAQECFQPGNWTCPICHTPDPEWNLMLSCAKCGYGPRVMECPHCREDFDSWRAMGDYTPGPVIDFMSVDKYRGPQSEYRVRDLAATYSSELDEDAKQRVSPLLTGAEFTFPGSCGQIRTIGIFSVWPEESNQNRTWIWARLYAKDVEGDVGQLAFLAAPREGIVAKVVDVSREFILKDQKRNRATDFAADGPSRQSESASTPSDQRGQYRIADFMRSDQIYIHTLAQEMPRFAMPMHLAKRFFDNVVGAVFRCDGVAKSIIIWTAKYNLPSSSWADGYLYCQTLEEMDTAGWQNKPDPVARIYFACGGSRADPRIEVSDMRSTFTQS